MTLFFNPVNALILFQPDYPNSLLIILCQGLGMSIAVNYHAGQENIAPGCLPCAGQVARVAVFDEMAAAEPFWRSLERDDAWATPYQRFDLLAAWQLHVGARQGIVPFIVTGFDVAGRPLLLLPLGRKQVV